MVQASDSDFSTPSGASGTAIRTDRNSMFEALLTKNSGATEPATTFPGMWWIDTSQTPPELKLRNQADDDFDVVATIDPTNGVALFSEGSPIISLGNTGDFTEPQRIKKAGGAASLTITTDVDTGLASFLDLGGENSANQEIIGVSFDHRITTNTDGNESSELDIGVIRSGTVTVKATIGDEFTVTGTLNATTLEQGGVGVSSLIESAISTIGVPTTSATSVAVPSAITLGDMNTFTGSSPSIWTLNSGSAGDVLGVLNDGTADISFAEGAGVTLIGGTSLGQQKIATILYRTSTRVFIYGQNT